MLVSVGWVLARFATGSMISLQFKLCVDSGKALLCGAVLASGVWPAPAISAKQTDSSKPVIVQPGAPGQPTKILPPTTRAKLPPLSPGDIAFMQGMIMHHAQAVEMTDLIGSHSENKELRALGRRINSSQSDEIKFMERWLVARGEPVATPMHDMAGMPHADSDHSMSAMPLMPGMLTPEQMEALRKATGSEFDRLFLTGMIQHHQGALTMVKELFGTAGSGQDAEIFGFATDVDTGQRAEIRIMQGMLDNESEQKR